MFHTRTFRMVLAGVSLYLVAAGCKGPTPHDDMAPAEDLTAPADSGGADLASVDDLRDDRDLRDERDLRDDRDLSVPDLPAMPDLSVPDMFMPDLSVPRDMSMPDLRSPPDLYTPDLRPPADMSMPPDMAPCTGSASCGGSLCCADINVGAGTPPMCPVNSVSIACKATCEGKIGLSCNMMARVRLCDKAADCASDPGGYKNCCKVALGGLSSNVCLTDLLKGLLGGTCL